MDYLLKILLFSCAFVAIYFWLKPRAKPKSSPQKQEEIRQMYRQRLQTELSNIQNADERQTKKIALLKTFAKELEFNLFFDKDEAKVLIQELASY
ncbi:hypothetical protein [Sulfurospirillum sp.]|uniref:hypothetical protein n=1 Tax=Sulfurospirillum sp. TaxID=2053622 RepID=UPI002FDE508F